MVWKEKDMKSLCESIGDRSNFLSYVLYAVRFTPNEKRIALVHRMKCNKYGEPSEEGEWYYQISWMHPRSKTKISQKDIDDWYDVGESPWEGFTAEYKSDKDKMEANGFIYKLV